MDEFNYRWAEKYIELTDVTVGRREEQNKMFLVANSGLLAIESFLAFEDASAAQALSLAGLGMGLCLIWLLIANYYRNLMNAKGRVIKEQLETYMQVKPWKHQKDLKGSRIGHSLSIIELVMSTPFFGLNLLVVVYYWFERQWFSDYEWLVMSAVSLVALSYMIIIVFLFIRISLKKRRN